MDPGEELVSPDGTLKLVMQLDGNLALKSGTQILWASGTAANPNASAAPYVIMQSDGNLVIKNVATATGAWGAGIYTGYPWGSARVKLSLRNDGRLVLSTNDNKEIWTTWSPSAAAQPPRTVPLTTNQAWTATVSPSASWVTLSRSSGTGNASISVNVAQNTSAAPRSTTVYFKVATGSEAGKVLYSINIYQKNP